MITLRFSSSRSAMRFTNITLASTTPIPTAVMRSTKTVTNKTTIITRTSVRGACTICFRNRQSIISNPTLISRPARAARGIFSARGPKPSNVPRRTTAINMPEIGVRPPVRMFATDRMVAPAPGRPPKNPAAIFPIPWPINSRLESCWVRVMLSQTREVSRLSIVPNNARTRASSTMIKSALVCMVGQMSVGNPEGMSPITGRVGKNISATIVPTMRASNTGGRRLPIEGGVRYTMARVRVPTNMAGREKDARYSGIAMRLATTLDFASNPRKGAT